MGWHGEIMNAIRKLYGLIECCLNWRVVAGFAVVGVATFVYAPKLAITVLPVLVAMVCPASMLLMIWSMRRMNMGGRVDVQPEPALAFQNLNREEQLQVLEQRLERVQAQQRAIAKQVPQLERRLAEPEALASRIGNADVQATVS